MPQTRIDHCFQTLAKADKTAFIAFITAGDPDIETSYQLLMGLVEAGVDIIELGMPFSDPMADGIAIQNASKRALKAGMTLAKTLDLVRRFRQHDSQTPIVLMGYYNPIYQYGVSPFLTDAQSAGVDGLIIVDLPPEEDEEVCLPALKTGLNFIHLVSPTTHDKRLPLVLANTSGFIYYVSMTGITGADAPPENLVAEGVARVKTHTNLPIVVGFGIKTPEQMRRFARFADGVVVGSALVETISHTLDETGQATDATLSQPLVLARSMAQALNE